MTQATTLTAPANATFSWLRLWHMVRKEIKQLVRDPKARPLVFVSPIIQMLLLGYAATTDVKDIPTALMDHDRSAESRALVDAYRATGYFTFVERTDRAEEITNALQHGRVTVGLVIPPGFARDLHSGRGATVQALIDGSDASLATVAQSYASATAAQFGARVEGTQVTGGVELRSRAWFNPSLESRYFNVPAIMGTQIFMVCLLLTALGVVREREIGTLDQLLVSPITPTELILGKTIPILAIGLIHLVIYIGIAVFNFGVPLRGSFGALLFGALLFMVAGLAMGLLISTISRTQQEAFMLLVLILLPSVLMSGFMSPIDSMPQAFQWLTVINPMRYFLDISRGLFLKGVGVTEMWPQYVMLLTIATSLLLLAIRQFRRVIV